MNKKIINLMLMLTAGFLAIAGISTSINLAQSAAEWRACLNGTLFYYNENLTGYNYPGILGNPDVFNSLGTSNQMNTLNNQYNTTKVCGKGSEALKNPKEFSELYLIGSIVMLGFCFIELYLFIRKEKKPRQINIE